MHLFNMRTRDHRSFLDARRDLLHFQQVECLLELGVPLLLLLRSSTEEPILLRIFNMEKLSIIRIQAKESDDINYEFKTYSSENQYYIVSQNVCVLVILFGKN